jgi:hypothetical protein
MQYCGMFDTDQPLIDLIAHVVGDTDGQVAEFVHEKNLYARIDELAQRAVDTDHQATQQPPIPHRHLDQVFVNDILRGYCLFGSSPTAKPTSDVHLCVCVCVCVCGW